MIILTTVFTSLIYLLLSETGLSILLAALIGWLVGWLLSGLRRSRSAESLDAESAGGMRVSGQERTRLQQENAALKARINSLELALRERQEFLSQLGENIDLSSVLTAVRERNRLRQQLEEVRQVLQMRDEEERNRAITTLQLTTTN